MSNEKVLIKEGIMRSGFPLELRAKRIFRDTGFNVSTTYYRDTDAEGREKKRELDIRATRRLSKNGLFCELTILGECKSSVKKVFCFFQDEPKTKISRWENFPIFTGAGTIVEIVSTSLAEESFPVITYMVTEMEKEGPMERRRPIEEEKSKKWKPPPEKGRIVYTAANQLLKACIHWQNVLSKRVMRMIARFRDPIFIQDFDSFVKNQMSGMPIDSYIHEFLRSRSLERFDRELHIIPVDIIIPMLITDFPLFKVVFDEDLSTIVGLHELEYGLYLFRPSEIIEDPILGMEGQFPIIIVNEQNLDLLVKKLWQLAESVYEEVVTQHDPVYLFLWQVLRLRANSE